MAGICFAVGIVGLAFAWGQGGGRHGSAHSRYVLDLAGEMSGWLSTCSDGNASTDDAQGKVGSEPSSRKHQGTMRCEPMTLTCGSNMSPAFYRWLENTCGGQYPRMDGAIVTSNSAGRETSRLSFFQAIVTEIGLPSLDASSKSPGRLTVQLAPEITKRLETPSGSQFPIIGGQSQPWLTCNFRLTIEGLDCSSVVKIDALTLKQKVSVNTTGERRDFQTQPSGVEVPNLVITLPENKAKGFYDWRHQLVVSGKAEEFREKSGKLLYLAPDMKSVLFELDFTNLGISKITADKVETAGEPIGRVKATMFCEGIRFRRPRSPKLYLGRHSNRGR